MIARQEKKAKLEVTREKLSQKYLWTNDIVSKKCNKY